MSGLTVVAWRVGIAYFPFFLVDFDADFLAAVFFAAGRLAPAFFAAPRVAAFFAPAFDAALRVPRAADAVGRGALGSSPDVGSSGAPSAPDSINTTSDQRM